MNCNKTLGEWILATSGVSKTSLVPKRTRVVNVFAEALEEADVIIEGGFIVGVGSYDGVEEVGLGRMTLYPELMDGHIHLGSSMVSPGDFRRAVLPHGTTAVVTDPHEIANAAGTAGIRYMIETTENLDLGTFFMLPSCVSPAGLDESGMVLDAAALEPFYKSERVLGLAGLMNSYGAVKADTGVLEKAGTVLASGKLVDGHAPFFGGTGLNTYVTAGAISGYECSDIGEAREKYARGQWIMVRENIAAKNLEASMPLFETSYHQRDMLVTNDKHPGDLTRYGHIDYITRPAVRGGTDPVQTVKMGSFNTASYFGIKNRGVVTPGYLADPVLLKGLESFEILWVRKVGKAAAESGACLAEPVEEKNWDDSIKDRVSHSFYMEEIREEHLVTPELADGGAGKTLRVTGLMPDQLTTTEMLMPYASDASGEMQPVEAGCLAPGVDIGKDIVKLAAFERHYHAGHVGLGFLGGYGLKRGAVVSSIAHGPHNLIIAGTNDADMVLTGNRVRKDRGGLAVVVNGKLTGELPLPIGGLMTGASTDEVEKTLEHLKGELRRPRIPETVDPFITLGLVSLPVIPKLRLNTYGVIGVDSQSMVPTVF